MNNRPEDGDPTDQPDATTDASAPVELTSVASTYKVRGRLDADDGAGVVGRNDADSGTPIGVQGVVPNNPTGYGLETPDDARVEGALEATSGHSLTVDGTRVVRLDPPGSDGNVTGGGNVIGGWSGNSAFSDVVGAAIGGGGRKFNPNTVTDNYGTIGGGAGNTVGDSKSGVTSATHATIGGGELNTASGDHSTVGGGKNNTASGTAVTIAGGQYNKASGENATIGGGEENVAQGELATIAGGGSKDSPLANLAAGDHSAIGGGQNNRTGKSGMPKGKYATVPGGWNNLAREDYSFAAGRSAKAKADGAFVWGDSSSNAVESTSTNEVVIQAGGGVTMWSSSDFSSLVQLKSGDSSWTQGSSRAMKSRIEPVDPESVLAGVEAIDVSTWEYDTRPGVRHMGPMAEDFQETFGLGEDEEMISSVDADGVALAAIQGLAERLDDVYGELDAKNDRIDAQRERIERLESERDAQQEQIETLRSENRTLRDRLAAVEDHLALADGGSPGTDAAADD